MSYHIHHEPEQPAQRKQLKRKLVDYSDFLPIPSAYELPQVYLHPSDCLPHTDATTSTNVNNNSDPSIHPSPIAKTGSTNPMIMPGCDDSSSSVAARTTPYQAAVASKRLRYSPTAVTVAQTGAFFGQHLWHAVKRVHSRDFKLHAVIGEGAFGRVITCEKTSGADRGSIYAMKLIKKERVCSSDHHIKNHLKEFEILTSIQHPFIISLKYAFTTPTALKLVMEFSQGGDMFSHLQHHKRLPEYAAKFYIGQLILALGYLHQKNIVYRDLKTENVLLDSRGYIKLTDFGLSRIILPGHVARSFSGTVDYMAPEMVPLHSEDRSYGLQVDWWALGVLLYQMLHNDMPFKGADQPALLEKIRNSTRCPSITANVSKNCRRFIRKLIYPSLQGRLCSAEQCMIQPFFSDLRFDFLINGCYAPPFSANFASNKSTAGFDKEFTALTLSESTLQDHGQSKAGGAQARLLTPPPTMYAPVTTHVLETSYAQAPITQQVVGTRGASNDSGLAVQDYQSVSDVQSPQKSNSTSSSSDPDPFANYYFSVYDGHHPVLERYLSRGSKNTLAL